MSAHQFQKKSNAPHWQVREFRDGDELQASRLFNRIFNKSVTPAQYRWKVVDMPFPIGCATTWIAESNGKIVGQYGGTAMRIWLNGQIYPVVHICDVMTHPDFRGQGILSALGSAANAAWRNAGVAFATGFPHAGWGSRRNFLGWQMMYKSVWMWRPLRLTRFIRQRIQNRLLKKRKIDDQSSVSVDKTLRLVSKMSFHSATGDMQIRFVEKPDDAFDALWETLKHRYEALVVRDRAWVNYRYADAPEMGYGLLFAQKKGKPAGYLAFRIREVNQQTIGYLADLFTAPDDLQTRMALIRHSRQYMYKAGATAALGIVSENTPMLKAFRRCGFIRRYGAFEVSIIPYLDNLPTELLRNSNRWFSMGGDFDIV